MKRIRAIIFSAMLLVTSLSLLPMVNPVSAQAADASKTPVGICSIIKPICDAILGEGNTSFSGTTAYNFLATRFNTILSIAFLAIILLGVYVVISAGIKFIRSQGDSGKIGEAQKAIQSVFLGIGAMFVGIVGIVLVLAFFGGTGILNNTLSPDTLFNSSSAAGGGGTTPFCDVQDVVGCIQRN